MLLIYQVIEFNYTGTRTLNGSTTFYIYHQQCICARHLGEPI